MRRAAISDIASVVPAVPTISVVAILTPERRVRTLALWLIYFMGFLAMYFMLSWIPTLFVDSGYTRVQGIDALTGFNLGALPGILLLGFLTTRLPLVSLLSLFFLAAAAVLVWIGLTPV